MNSAKKPSEVNPADYDLFFASAGHAAAYDYPRSKGLQKIIAEMYAAGKVIGAVCHGPTIFDNLKTLDGEIMIKGKKITGFTDEGEVVLSVDKAMADRDMKTVKEVAAANGATYVDPPDMWGSFSVVDGGIITGENPASAAETTENTVAVWKAL